MAVDTTDAARQPVSRRRIPYPYRAILAICSDLDETPDRFVYEETARFLNTTETTAMGPGLGLEVGNSIYFDMPPSQFAYWNTDEAGRTMVRALIRSGHIDCLHSFGDRASTRGHAQRAIDELERHDCRIRVWVDHARAPSNFGADIMHGRGDLRDSEVYHADESWGFGVRYVWLGRVTSVVGQDIERRLAGIWHPQQPLGSTATLAKEAAKGLLGAAGSTKYRMNWSNEVLRPTELRSGQPVWEFLRSNPHWGGVSRGETASGIAEVINAHLLDLLVEREGVCVLYTHLGKIRDRVRPIGEAACAALRLLADLASAGRILVTTTRRVLDYCRAARAVEWRAHSSGGARHIAAAFPGDGSEAPAADGLTFHVPDPTRTTLSVNGLEVHDLQRNPPDQAGRPSISVPWRRLEFPRW